MTYYQLDYVVEEVNRLAPTSEQRFLRDNLNLSVGQSEATQLFRRISDHKWLVSERLQRDVGMRVAALDFYENVLAARRPTRAERLRQFAAETLRRYFLSKSSLLPQ